MKNDADIGVATWSEEEVAAHLERLLASKTLARSNSLSSFLRFVVEETMAGRGGRLKARTIAIHALGRKKNFDPKSDPIVSIQASRLRRVLADHYEQEGRGEPIRITLPKGTYQPTFQQAVVAAALTRGDAIPPSTDSPCVAVLPLLDLDASDSNAYFGVGLTQELVAAIANFQELTVVDVPPLEAGESVGQVASKLARDWSVRFVLSGTFRKTDSAVVLRMQLTDALSAAVVWTEKITRQLVAEELFDLEEDIARHVASSVAENYGVIPRAMTKEVHTKRTDEISVYDAVLRFRHYQCVVTDEARDRAIGALEKALQLDPNYALCWAMLSEAVCDAYGLRIDCEKDVVTRAKELARRAIALDADCQHAYWSLAYAHFHSRERREFLSAAEKTIELNPNNGYLVGISAWAMALAGEWDRGLSLLQRVMAQNPYYPTWMHLVPYLDHYRKGDFEGALEHANRFNIPGLAWDPILRAAALARIGRPEEAEAALNEFTSNFPAAAGDAAHYLRGYIFLDELVEEVVDGLRMAGWSRGRTLIPSGD